jgi:hypothetical protein
MQLCGILIVVESCTSMRGYCRQNGARLQAVYASQAHVIEMDVGSSSVRAILALSCWMSGGDSQLRCEMTKRRL